MSGEVPATLHPALQTPFCDLVGVRLPVVQTGMGWVSGPALTAATCAAGGLGILASVTMTLGELEDAIATVKATTGSPFGVNLRADQEDVDARVSLMIREGVRLASFAGPPRRDLITRLKDHGILTMPTVGAPRHAEKMAEWGVDALIAQGGEGGGHTGEIPTSLLLPAVVDAVDIPVLGAGGFKDGRGLVAALSFGAAGVAMGTRFLLTRESPVPDHVKATYLETGSRGTVVTRAIDGHPQRVIRTEMVTRLERSGPIMGLLRAIGYALAFRKVTGTSMGALMREGLAMRRRQELSWRQLAMAANAPMMTRATMVDGKTEVGILPTGQVVGAIDALPSVAELMGQLVTDAHETLGRLAAAEGPS